jgi:hypothetical protein
MTRCLIGVLVGVTELGALLAVLADANERFKVSQVIRQYQSGRSIHNWISNQLSFQSLVEVVDLHSSSIFFSKLSLLPYFSSNSLSSSSFQDPLHLPRSKI